MWKNKKIFKEKEFEAALKKLKTPYVVRLKEDEDGKVIGKVAWINGMQGDFSSGNVIPRRTKSKNIGNHKKRKDKKLTLHTKRYVRN
jgi:hypothetical protein